MGNWYANIALRGPSQPDTLAALRDLNRTAFVSQPSRGFTFIDDLQCSKMDGDDSDRLTAKLSERFACLALIALNADDDALWLCIYDRGRRAAEYDSTTPARSGARDLCRAMARPAALPILWVFLQAPFIFEVLRHLAVSRILRLPRDLSIHSYRDIDCGDLLPPLFPDQFRGTREP